jgi:hypothetical protein
VDVGRVDPEGRISATKTQMSEWLEDASRRQPSLLVLDGLDSLLVPENEVCLNGNTIGIYVDNSSS